MNFEISDTMTEHRFTTPLTEQDVRQLRVGDSVLLDGIVYGVRDANMIRIFDQGMKPPVDWHGAALLHTAPNVRKVGPGKYEPISVGTTTSMRERRCLHSVQSNKSQSFQTSRVLTGAQPCGVIHDSALDLCVKGRHMLVVKRNLAADEDVEHDTKAPYINLWTGVRFRVEKLGGGKIQRTAERCQVGCWIVEIGKAEINNFDIAGLGDEDVLYFQV